MVMFETMNDCDTQNKMQLYFEEYNVIDPKIYAELALSKLKDITENQINNLKKLIDDNIDIEGRTGWDSYCHILSVDQINHVGW